MYGERYGRRERDEPTEVKDDGRLTELEFCWFGSADPVPKACWLAGFFSTEFALGATRLDEIWTPTATQRERANLT